MDTSADHGGFGPLLRAARRAAGFSQRQLADRVGMSVAAVRDLEQGRSRRPRPQFVAALVRALGLTGDTAAAFRRAAADPDSPWPVDEVRQLRIRILGPLSVELGAGSVPVGRGRRRAVLGRLALSANAAVPVDDLVDLLWPTDPPPNPVHALHTYLSRLRSALQPAEPGRAGVVRRTPAGYQLDVADDQLDLADFRRRVVEARTAEPVRALDLLEAALALWRGRPLADLPELRHSPLVAAVEEERIAATLRYADLALAAEQAGRCLSQLRVLAAAHPLHEPLHARLITALATSNLQASALEAYREIRGRLVGELGIEPGPELVGAQRRVLRQEAVAVTGQPPTAPPSLDERRPPAQLPADIQQFAGRVAALERLDGIAAAPGAAVVITAVSGTAGIGKSALAVHWAHRVRHRFPDGQLHVNLRGFHPSDTPMTPGEVLHGFLVALGLAPARVPADLHAQAALYRTLLAGKRVLVLLDNARDAEQVRPLLPGAPGCLVLVTSRHGLTGLVAAEGALSVPLELLTVDEARDLLARRLGADRVAAEADAVDLIIERCGRLPLALAIAAARAIARPHLPLSRLAAELRDSGGRLDALTTGDPGTEVRTVFSWSYRLLKPTTARLFRLLGLHPGVDITTSAAASLAGLGSAEVAPLLAELTRVHLLSEPTPGRYVFHDLLQAYAAERAGEEDTATVRRDALTRLFDLYLHTAQAAMRVLFPAEQAAGPAAVPMRGPGVAREWLDSERANLVAVARHGWPGHTIALATTLYRYFDGGYFTDALIVHACAHEAARRAGDAAAEGRALDNIGVAYRRTGRFQQAATYHERAMTRCREIGDRSGEARAMSNLGIAYWRLGDYGPSEQHHRNALDLYREAGDRLGEAHQLNSIGVGTRQSGDHEKAIEYHTQGLALFRQLGHRFGEADALGWLGTAYLATGDYERAIDCEAHAMAIFQELGHRPGEGLSLNHLGETFLRMGEPSVARDHFERALAMCRDIGERNFELGALIGLGSALLAEGDPAAAHAQYTGALALAEHTGDRVQQAGAHDGLGETLHAVGDLDAARQHWHHALSIYDDIGLPEADHVREKLRARDRI